MTSRWTDIARVPHPATFEGRVLPHQDEPPFDQGLQFDIETLLNRRSLLRLFGYGAVAAGVTACVGTSEGTSLPTSASTAASSAAGECATIPEETAGPYPGDGSNGPDVLSQSGVVRQDITSSFGTSTTVATGVPLTISIALQDITNGCAPLPGAAVYVWQCDQQGRYSMYGRGVENENYLRGVQAAGSDGVATFQSIFPGCYSGRWPHIHFEVFPSLELATDDANKVATSQIALPEEICNTVYASGGYEASVANMTQVSLSRDNVFGEDGGARQLGSVTGDLTSGITVLLPVPVRIG